jgi:methionyl-tRNA formyltransferase
VINLHSGLLPNYRGVMATFWTLLNGDKQLVTSLHFIDDSTIDTGGIIANSTLLVQQDESYLWHVLSLYIWGVSID